MNIHPILTLAACITLAASVGADTNSYCNDETPLLGEPKKPVMKYSYTTQIAAKWIDLKTMQQIYESYDHKDKKVSYDSRYRGQRDFVVNTLSKGELLYYLSGLCVHFNFSMTGQTEKDESIRGLEMLTNLGTSITWKYKGEATIRGVQLQKWSGCKTWTDYANFTVDYFFTKKDQIPFRLEFKGVKRPTPPQTSATFHRVYDYFLFSKGKPSPDNFKPPPGNLCGGYVPAITPPVPMSAFYKEEEIDPITKTVRMTRVVFDKQHQISKEEDDDKITIRDFKRAITYQIQKNNNNQCVRKPFYMLGRLDRTVDKHGQIHMATLKHFFMDDGNFTYNGVYKARGIKCDVYTKASQSADELGQSLVEIYVAKGTVVSAATPIMRIVLKGGLIPMVRKQFEIYDFNPKPLAYYNPFDLRNCFNKEQTIKFKLIFKGKGGDNFNWHREMKKNMDERLRTVLGINFLRVRLNTVYGDEGGIMMSGDLFDREGYQDEFETLTNRKRTGIKSANSVVYHHSSNSPTACSEFCINKKNRPFKTPVQYCSSFQFDRSNKDCTFFFAYSSASTFDHHVDLYQRTSGFYDNVYLGDAWGKLKKLVASGSLNYTDSNGEVLKAVSVSRTDGTQQTTDNQEMDKPMTQFSDISGVIISEPVEVITSIYRDACARHCINSLKYNCEAFMYELSKHKCSFYDSQLHRERNAQGSTKPKQTTYVRSYTANFEPIPGRTVLSPISDYVYTGIEGDINGCAELCVKHQDFFCQSFEFCGDTCLLGRKHIHDFPKSSLKEDFNCIHYSRKYIQDYAKTEHKKALSNSNAVVLKGIGVKRCATICSTSSSYDCNVFQYCDPLSECRISTTKTDSLTYQDTGDCDLYSRKKGRQRFINSYSTLASDDSGEHSPGSMGGIAVGMIVVGIILMVLVVLVVFKLRSPASHGSGGGSVGFSRNKLDEF